MPHRDAVTQPALSGSPTDLVRAARSPAAERRIAVPSRDCVRLVRDLMATALRESMTSTIMLGAHVTLSWTSALRLDVNYVSPEHGRLPRCAALTAARIPVPRLLASLTWATCNQQIAESTCSAVTSSRIRRAGFEHRQLPG